MNSSATRFRLRGNSLAKPAPNAEGLVTTRWSPFPLPEWQVRVLDAIMWDNYCVFVKPATIDTVEFACAIALKLMSVWVADQWNVSPESFRRHVLQTVREMCATKRMKWPADGMETIAAVCRDGRIGSE